ncbi:hypothetical protein [Lysobacter sp. Root96]|uniref:hypothetical protein n=1 Tax=Lysobacter sp. Root96 TaxID=1736612 RepID=UPI0006F8F73D|nr:hypothetical protein [Lysobacter sp. Root96]KRC32038.1 hypothetical protein ASE10_15870 [Lysobacter sp. Root76]KRD67501.1 hypothetical protein ASE45_12045 [Lysobacter sp. Root96]
MRKRQGIAVVAFAALAMMFSGGVGAIDSRGAVRAANVWTKFHPGDDIRNDIRASRVQIADLDRDGVDEVVYLLTATCIGASFDCTNDVVVMTPLRKGDPRLRPGRLDNDYMTDLWRRAEQSGYGDDTSLHVPGDVRALAIVGDRVQVTFDVVRDSPICKRSLDRGSAGPCPEPGRYRWTLSWREGALSKTREILLGRDD